MPQPHIKVFAVYKVRMTSELIEEGLEVRFNENSWSESEREEAREEVKAHIIEEIDSAVLIELLVTNVDTNFDLIDFHQPGSDQAPYAETYLSEDGLSVIPSDPYKVPEGDIIRVAFFLHYYEPDKPLMTSYGKIPLPPAVEMPEYLKELVPYHPVD